MSDKAKTLAEIWEDPNGYTERWPEEVTRRLDALTAIFGPEREETMMPDRALAELWYEDKALCRETMRDRMDVLWKEREESHLVLALETCKQAHRRNVEQNNTLTADNAALRAKNEALEKQARLLRIRLLQMDHERERMVQKDDDDA